MTLGSVSVNLRSIGVSRARLVGVALVVVFLTAVGIASYVGFSHLEQQRAEIQVLVRDLATTRLERGDLQQRSAELTEDLVRANIRISGLQTELATAQGEVRRLEDEAGTLRDRLQVARAETRDAASEADAQRAARERDSQLNTAVLAVADTSTALSRTRDRMIDVLNQQIAAERTGRAATARALVTEYNELVGTHNRQLTAFNGAISRLRSLVR